MKDIEETANEKYKRLKAQIHAGILLPKEDFLFVKLINQRSNAQRSLRRRRWNRFFNHKVLYGGFNTAPR